MHSVCPSHGCDSVWNQYTKSATGKIEMVQRRAAIYVLCRYHNTSIVWQTCWIRYNGHPWRNAGNAKDWF